MLLLKKKEKKRKTDLLHVNSRLVVLEFSIFRNLRALFSSKIFGKMSTVTISFVFDKYCSIIVGV